MQRDGYSMTRSCSADCTEVKTGEYKWTKCCRTDECNGYSEHDAKPECPDSKDITNGESENDDESVRQTKSSSGERISTQNILLSACLIRIYINF